MICARVFERIYAQQGSTVKSQICSNSGEGLIIKRVIINLTFGLYVKLEETNGKSSMFKVEDLKFHGGGSGIDSLISDAIEEAIQEQKIVSINSCSIV